MIQGWLRHIRGYSNSMGDAKDCQVVALRSRLLHKSMTHDKYDICTPGAPVPFPNADLDQLQVFQKGRISSGCPHRTAA